MKQILVDTADTSESFRLRGNRSLILMADFQAGSDWVLQMATPEAIPRWLSTTYTLSASGPLEFRSFPGVVYRVSGGAVGAVAWVADDSEFCCP